MRVNGCLSGVSGWKKVEEREEEVSQRRQRPTARTGLSLCLQFSSDATQPPYALHSPAKAISPSTTSSVNTPPCLDTAHSDSCSG